MRWTAIWFPVVATGAALFVVLLAPGQVRPTADRVGDWEPAEAAGWADPAGARLNQELDARRRGVAERSLSKSEVALALARGELTLDQAADRFRQLNRGDPDKITLLRPAFPGASDAELVFRQVLLFVRGTSRLDQTRIAACLPRLEDEVNHRFPRNRSADRILMPVAGGLTGSAVPPASPMMVQAAVVR